MTDDPLEAAVRAFQAETVATGLDAQAIRRRLLQSARTRRARAARIITWLASAAACLVGSVALAAQLDGGGRVWSRCLGWADMKLPGPRGTSRGTDVAGAEPSNPVPAASAVRNAPSSEPGTERSLVPSAPEPRVGFGTKLLPLPSPSPAQDRQRVDVPAAEPSERHGETAGQAPREPPRGAEPIESHAPIRDGSKLGQDLTLYRAAHRLHFGGAAPERALDAWDRYLAAFPQGALALEARYNRALCLLRAGRVVEARQALEEFASGRWGAYRRERAMALLHALNRAP